MIYQNDTVKNMINRFSVRRYQAGKSIPQSDIDTILAATQQSPTYINGQQYSVIVITDQEKKNKMLEYTMPSSGQAQQHIADCGAFFLFVVDFNKLNLVAQKEKSDLVITDYMEGLLIGSVDVGIGAEAATIAAESLGYGTVMIGAVRRSANEIIKDFNLPEYVFPMLGLCIGVPVENTNAEPRPRLPLSTFVHYNNYSLKDFGQILDQYNETIAQYQQRQGMPVVPWTNFVSMFYGKSYWEELSTIYKKQKFNIK